MTKAESIAYLKRLQWKEEEDLAASGGTIPATKQDLIEELEQMKTFREFSRDKENEKED